MFPGVMNRRSSVQWGPLALLGGSLAPAVGPEVFAAPTRDGGNNPTRSKAKACILLFQVGGPYQCDTFDPKPGAPADVRGPYRRTATSASGVFISEGLAQVAKHADKIAIVRSVNHLIRCHNPAIYCSLVG